jgi:ParB/RepB/Spo0J family partition protein
MSYRGGDGDSEEADLYEREEDTGKGGGKRGRDPDEDAAEIADRAARRANVKAQKKSGSGNNNVGSVVTLMEKMKGVDPVELAKSKWRVAYMKSLIKNGYFEINSREELPLLIPGTRVRIPVAFLERYEEQPRITFDPKKIARLSASIAIKGDVNKFIDVAIRQGQKGFFCLIIGGERRWLASIEAGITHVSCIINGSIDDSEIFVESVADNMGKEPLTTIEESMAVKRLCTDYNMTDEQIADRLAKSVQSIQQTRRYLTLNQEFLQDLYDGKLTKSVALILARYALENQPAVHIIVKDLKKERRSIPVNDLDLLVTLKAQQIGIEKAPGSTKGKGKRPEASIDLLVKKFMRGKQTFRALLKLLNDSNKENLLGAKTNVTEIIGALDDVKEDIEKISEMLNELD